MLVLVKQPVNKSIKRMGLKSINWGIIGCGDVAEVKSGPAFYKVQNSSLIAVMRRNEEKVKDFAQRHHVPNWTTDASELIAHEQVNAVYIATPPSSHLMYALEAIQAGKNVYLEKPMVLNSNEADILLNALKISSVKLTVAHYRRSLPLFDKVKELLDSYTIGKILSVEIDIAQTETASLIAKSNENWRTNPEISGGGYFHDIAPHQLDLMCYYFGEVVKMKKSAIESHVKSIDCVKGELEFNHGIQFKGSWNFAASKDIDKCVIYGEEGTILFSFYGDALTVTKNNKTQNYHFENPIHVQQPMIENVVAYFQGNNQNPCTVQEAAVVTNIMDEFCRKA